MKKYFIFCCVAFSAALCSFGYWQSNQPPVVTIVGPKPNTAFEWGSQVSYQISVADKEDGDSRYDEIAPLEVLLEVRYYDGKIKPVQVTAGNRAEPAGLTIMRSSNCFNCHKFTGTLIGPSYADIAAKYPATPANIALLVKHIKEGSVGVWGKVAMPTHTELPASDISTMVKWLLKEAKDTNVSYYTGLDGVFKTRPQDAGKKGFYVLTATYTDHGDKNAPAADRASGKDVLVMPSK
jgi:cytochrome c